MCCISSVAFAPTHIAGGASPPTHTALVWATLADPGTSPFAEALSWGLGFSKRQTPRSIWRRGAERSDRSDLGGPVMSAPPPQSFPALAFPPAPKGDEQHEAPRSDIRNGSPANTNAVADTSASRDSRNIRKSCRASDQFALTTPTNHSSGFGVLSTTVDFHCPYIDSTKP